MNTLLRLPLALVLTGVFSLSMMLPALVALRLEEFHDARSFFYSGLLGVLVTAFVALALGHLMHNRRVLRQLLALMAGFALLPLVLAVPFYESVRNTSFLSAYFEMVSCLTTTGATLFQPGRLSVAEHLWRAQVGWMGGLIMWIAAAAILAPLTLGGFEVTAKGEPGQPPDPGAARRDQTDPAGRLARSVRELTPIYAGLTVIIGVLLLVAGDPPLVAVTHAMSVMATSGISPIAGPNVAPSGLLGEVVIFCFFIFALSRLTFSGDTSALGRKGLRRDPEFRMALLILAAVPAVLFLRHWSAAFDVGEQENFAAALHALWGSLFTTLSFLTTTGFVSSDWQEAQGWSGLATPGLILMGLAILGGGVATTAGGVKLLRVYALYANGVRELERLIHPHSIGRTGLISRRVRREGSFIAWVFFMLFAVSIALLSMGLGLFGVRFEPSLVMTIAALTNTGPLIPMASETPISLIALAPGAKLLLCAAMVMGRLELLAIIVMLNPEIWRD